MNCIHFAYISIEFDGDFQSALTIYFICLFLFTSFSSSVLFMTLKRSHCVFLVKCVLVCLLIFRIQSSTEGIYSYITAELIRFIKPFSCQCRLFFSSSLLHTHAHTLAFLSSFLPHFQFGSVFFFLI